MRRKRPMPPMVGVVLAVFESLANIANKYILAPNHVVWFQYRVCCRSPFSLLFPCACNIRLDLGNFSLILRLVSKLKQ